MLGTLVKGDLGGSSQCGIKDVGMMLSNVPEFISKPGGSIANMTRGLASGFGIKCNLVGVRGNDEWGVMFQSSMKRAHVNLDGLVTKVRAPASLHVCAQSDADPPRGASSSAGLA